jgi:hypothetical protein
MLRQTLCAAAFAAASSTAQAGSTLQTVEHAAEVPLLALQLPTRVGGSVRFATCGGCETRAVALPGSTRYVVNNRPATYEAFAAAVTAAQARAETANRSLAALYFDAASKRLVRIALVAPLPGGILSEPNGPPDAATFHRR